MSTIEIQMPFESLLESLPKLSPEQLEIVAQKAAHMRAKQRAESLDSAETTLLKQIQAETISVEAKTRCAELTNKQQEAELTAEEMSELEALINQMETANAHRLSYLYSLANLRGVDLDTVITQLELQPLSYE